MGGMGRGGARGLEGFLPVGQLTLLVGDPGTGKSWVAVDMAVRAARARSETRGAAAIKPPRHQDTKMGNGHAGVPGLRMDTDDGAGEGDKETGGLGDRETGGRGAGQREEARGETQDAKLERQNPGDETRGAGGETRNAKLERQNERCGAEISKLERQDAIPGMAREEEEWGGGLAVYLSLEDTAEDLEMRAWGCGMPSDAREGEILVWEGLSLVPEKGGGESSLVKLVRERFEGLRCGLMVLDPLPAFLGMHDARGAAAVRGLIMPLLELAREHRFAVLGVTHLNKGRKSGGVLARTMGSLAYTALARSVLAVMADEEEAGRRVVVPVKCNGRVIEHGWGFRIENAEFGVQNSEVNDGRVPRKAGLPGVVWEEEVVREHELLGGAAGRTEAEEIEEGKLAFAVEFLKWELGNGPGPTTEVLQEARAQGIARRTLERAKHALKTVSYYDDEEEEWMVKWPEAVGD